MNRADAPPFPFSLGLAGALSLACFMGFGRFSFTPILPGMMADLGLSAGDAGLIAAANFAGYLAGAFLAAGTWAQGMERRIVMAALTLTAALLGAMALVSSLSAFMAIRFLAGLASAFGLVFTSALVLSAARGDARVQAMHFGGVGFGIALSAFVSFVAVPLLGAEPPHWRSEWLAGAGLVLAAGAAILFLLPKGQGTAGRGGAEPPMLWTGAMLRLILSYAFFGFGYVVAGTFLVVMAREGASGHSVEFLCWLISGLAGMVSLFLWQPMLSTRGVNTTYRLALALEALGSVAMVLLPAAIAPVIGGLLFGGTFIVVTAYALQIGRALSPESPRRVMALMTAGFGIGQIVGPVAAGHLVDLTGDYLLASLIAAAVLGLGALVAPGRGSH
ncbi:YbfB/YjiJ family MFS transporter [Gellertiella hungarica]|uniref:Putative MFS family arabinose efflux permease n=1 Tax=Gellertiella hungarica TaxID=1572859 RepID=A0A7W6NJI4_9HYPH|nr:YbfB/YjiJ family MFS transporter [Gellertiella hungarica]MBB4063322.1 putative MFS family arabinose efflux permease [Gellertiella hungarica]